MSIFTNLSFLNESNNDNEKKISLNECYNVINEASEIFKDCSCFVTEEMITECSNDRDLITRSAILEGAKMDLFLKNFLEEGKDYKGLKKDMREIIKANDLSDEQLKSRSKGFIHTCKRILQILSDIEACIVTGAIAGGGGATAIFTTITGGPVAGLITLATVALYLIINLVVNRIFRLVIDTVEFKEIKNDAEDIVSDLRLMAKKSQNDKLKKKYNSEADKLEKSIEKYSKKKKD